MGEGGATGVSVVPTPSKVGIPFKKVENEEGDTGTHKSPTPSVTSKMIENTQSNTGIDEKEEEVSKNTTNITGDNILNKNVPSGAKPKVLTHTTESNFSFGGTKEPSMGLFNAGASSSTDTSQISTQEKVRNKKQRQMVQDQEDQRIKDSSVDVILPAKYGPYSRDDVINGISKVIPEGEIVAVGPRQKNNQWSITFDSSVSKMRLFQSEVKIKGQHPQMSCAGTGLKVVRAFIHWVPYYVSNAEVAGVLQKNCNVRHVKHAPPDRSRGHDIYTGVRHAIIETEDVSLIPGILEYTIDGEKAEMFIIVPGRPAMCFRCRQLGHVRNKCPLNNVCRRPNCGATGHLTEDCPLYKERDNRKGYQGAFNDIIDTDAHENLQKLDKPHGQSQVPGKSSDYSPKFKNPKKSPQRKAKEDKKHSSIHLLSSPPKPQREQKDVKQSKKWSKSYSDVVKPQPSVDNTNLDEQESVIVEQQTPSWGDRCEELYSEEDVSSPIKFHQVYREIESDSEVQLCSPSPGSEMSSSFLQDGQHFPSTQELEERTLDSGQGISQLLSDESSERGLEKIKQL